MSLKATQRIGQQEAAPVPFINPDPIDHLVGCSNETTVIVDGQRTTLIDLGAQVSSISSWVLCFVMILPCSSNLWVGCWN